MWIHAKLKSGGCRICPDSPCGKHSAYALDLIIDLPDINRYSLGEEEKSSSIKQEILDKISALVTAAFGLVAALAWNDAIKLLFKEIFGTQDQVGPMILYALLVTIIAVILTIIVARAASKAKNIIVKTYSCSLCDFKTQVQSELMEHNVKEHAASRDKFLSK